MTSYNKLVKGATKVKMAPPKQKYVDPILLGTANPMEFEQIVSQLTARINNCNIWSVVYKTLIVVHLMISIGEQGVTLRYFAKNLEFFNLERILNSSKWSQNDLVALQRYDNYLKIRCREFGKYKLDFIRDAHVFLNKDNNLDLEMVESILDIIKTLVRNRYSSYDLQNNPVLMYAFKLLIQDLLALYNVLNEGVINLLESFFDLDYKDAEWTLTVYKDFVDTTEDVVAYLKIGKSVGMQIPVIKHITTKLIRSLEDHLHNTKQQPQSQSQNINKLKTNDTNNSSKSAAEQRLQQIREQKRILQQQLQESNQQQQSLRTPTVPQQQGFLNNPFTPELTTPNTRISSMASPQSYNPFTPEWTGNLTNGTANVNVNNTGMFTFETLQPQQLVTTPTNNPFLMQHEMQQQQQQQQQQQNFMNQPYTQGYNNI